MLQPIFSLLCTSPLPSFLSNSLNCSKPQFPHWKSENNIYLLGWLDCEASRIMWCLAQRSCSINIDFYDDWITPRDLTSSSNCESKTRKISWGQFLDLLLPALVGVVGGEVWWLGPTARNFVPTPYLTVEVGEKKSVLLGSRAQGTGETRALSHRRPGRNGKGHQSVPPSLLPTL